MKTPAKPYSLRRTIAIGLAAAIAFAAVSLFFLFLQAQGTHHRLAGEVVSVELERVHIRNARDVDTVLVVPPDAELHGIPSVEMLVPGEHVMTRGRFLEDGSFEVDRLRVLKDFERK